MGIGKDIDKSVYDSKLAEVDKYNTELHQKYAKYKIFTGKDAILKALISNYCPEDCPKP